jgi:MFS family permease
MQFTAQDWLVLELSHNSGTALGVVTGLQFAPVLLLTLYGGKLADRYDKRRILIVAHTAFTILALMLGILVATNLITLTLIYVFAALTGTASAIETPVRQAFVSELVEPELLPNALSLSAATFNSARIIGPAVAGVAIGGLGLGPLFLTNSLMYVGPLVFLLRMNPAQLRVPEKAPEQTGGVRDGLRYVWRRPDLVLPMALLFAIAMVGFNFQLTLPLLAKTVFGSGPERFGLLTTALAVGALAGALGSSGRRSRPSIYIVLGAAIGFGVLETLVGFGPTFWTTAVLLVPTGFFMVYLAQATNQRIQLGVDPTYRGRVMALYVLVFLGTTPVGAPLVGFLSQRLGPRFGVWSGGLVTLLAGLTALAWELRRSGNRIRLQLRPLPRFVVTPAETPTPTPVRV